MGYANPNPNQLNTLRSPTQGPRLNPCGVLLDDTVFVQFFKLLHVVVTPITQVSFSLANGFLFLLTLKKKGT